MLLITNIYIYLRNKISFQILFYIYANFINDFSFVSYKKQIELVNKGLFKYLSCVKRSLSIVYRYGLFITIVNPSTWSKNRRKDNKTCVSMFFLGLYCHLIKDY